MDANCDMEKDCRDDLDILESEEKDMENEERSECADCE